MKKSSFFKIPWARFGAKPKSRPKKKKKSAHLQKSYTKNLYLYQKYYTNSRIHELEIYLQNGGLIVAIVYAEWWSYCRKPKCRTVVLLSQTKMQNGGLIVAIAFAEWWSHYCNRIWRMVVLSSQTYMQNGGRIVAQGGGRVPGLCRQTLKIYRIP